MRVMDKKKTINSNLLMGIGIVLVFIAGCVFVTNAWGYLSNPAKQLCLLIVMGALFFGYFEVKEKLEKTASAFYYLGTATSGFLTYSVLRNSIDMNFGNSTTTALVVAVIIIGFKIIVERKKRDVVLEYGLVMTVSIATCAMTHGDYNLMLTIWISIRP